MDFTIACLPGWFKHPSSLAARLARQDAVCQRLAEIRNLKPKKMK
jgi:hypothetical protein